MRMKQASSLVIAAVLAGFLTACEEAKDGPAEEMGKKIDNATDEAGKALEEAGEEVEDAAH